MFKERFSLSTDDFVSGRFTKVARIIQKNWPRPEKINLSKAQEVLAETLGYLDYHDAQKSATPTCPVKQVLRPFGLEYRLNRILQVESVVCDSFLEMWPLHMLGRWNMAGRPCIFGSESINQAIEVFTEYFAIEKNTVDGFHVKHTQSALSLLATELKQKTYYELEKPLGSLISRAAGQVVFERAIDFFYDEFFTSRYLKQICENSGMSYIDIWKLPKNKSSFPDLYAALDDLYNSWLHEPAINRFYKSRLPSGFYNDDPYPDRGRDNKASIITFPNYRVEVHLDRISLEDSPLKAYRLKARSLRSDGTSLAEVDGGFVVGNKDGVSSTHLIEATEECGVAGVYAYLRHRISSIEGMGFDVNGLTPTNFDAGEIFYWGNLLIITYLERNERAAPGSGLELVDALIHDLKRRYKRNLSVCGVVDPLQYHLAAREIPALEARRFEDSKKLTSNFKKLHKRHDVNEVHFELETDTRIPCEYYYEAITSAYQ